MINFFCCSALKYATFLLILSVCVYPFKQKIVANKFFCSCCYLKYKSPLSFYIFFELFFLKVGNIFLPLFHVSHWQMLSTSKTIFFDIYMHLISNISYYPFSQCPGYCVDICMHLFSNISYCPFSQFPGAESSLRP